MVQLVMIQPLLDVRVEHAKMEYLELLGDEHTKHINTTPLQKTGSRDTAFVHRGCEINIANILVFCKKKLS